MAFTEDQKLNISMILGVTPTFLDAQLTSLGASLTAAREAAVLEQVDLWDAGVGVNYVRLTPTESNYGTNTDADDAKAAIRMNIAILLEMQDVVSIGYSSIGTIQCGV